jgi:hypothetical protein
MTPRHLQQQQKLQERRSAGGGKKTFMGTMTALLGESMGWLSVLLLLLLLCAVLLITDHMLLGFALFQAC